MIDLVQHTKTFLQSHTRWVGEASSFRRAGILMLYVHRDEELYFLLTKRTEAVEHHKGQISFPGGVQDVGDADLVETALRETEEEIGLPPNAVQVLGLFDDYPTHTGFLITPVVGYIDHLPQLTLNTEEVAEVLEVPVSIFLDPERERRFTIEREGAIHDVYSYEYNGYEIWGVTAAIIRSFFRAMGVRGG
jgi:8-oxo-dGTP pyrophosphatase MutT (NUDIX family)